MTVATKPAPGPLAIGPIELDAVIQEIHDLPSLPEVVIDIMASLESEDVDIHVLAHKVAHDQALTAKTLRFANSSYYAAQAKVTSLQQAITLLGVQAVRNLITAAAMSGCLPEKPCAGFDFTAFWRHSMAVGVCARHIARHLHLNQDMAFVAGLLHDIGRLVLVTCFTKHYEATIAYRNEHDCQLIDAEHAVLGIDHVEAGRILAVQWQFPAPLVHAISQHHAPQSEAGWAAQQLVHVANAVVHALDLSGDEHEMVPPLWDSAWDALDLSRETWLTIMHETELEFSEMNRVI